MTAAEWRSRHDALARRAAESNCDILLLGDGVAEGWAATELWTTRYPRLSIVNVGIPFDTTSQLLWRLQNGGLGNLRPRLAVLMIGTSNLLDRRHDPDEVVAGIRAIVSEFQSHRPATRLVIVTLPPVDAPPRARLRKRIRHTNEQLAREVHDGFSVFVLDASAALIAPDRSVLTGTIDSALHRPTSEGYRRLAETLFPELERLVGRL